jgi:hypothetical protein
MKLSKDEQRKYREANPDNAGPIYEPEPKWFGSSILPTIILPVAPFGCVLPPLAENFYLPPAVSSKTRADLPSPVHLSTVTRRWMAASGGT